MKSWIAPVVGLGILLMLVGVIAHHYADTQKESDTASTVKDIGVFLAGIGLVIGGLVEGEEDKFVRFGMILAGAILMAILWHPFSPYGM